MVRAVGLRARLNYAYRSLRAKGARAATGTRTSSGFARRHCRSRLVGILSASAGLVLRATIQLPQWLFAKSGTPLCFRSRIFLHTKSGTRATGTPDSGYLYGPCRAGSQQPCARGSSLSVPEASTWVMMLVGLAGLGLGLARSGRAKAGRLMHEDRSQTDFHEGFIQLFSERVSGGITPRASARNDRVRQNLSRAACAARDIQMASDAVNSLEL